MQAEIKPVEFGFGIFVNGFQVEWAHTISEANRKLERLMGGPASNMSDPAARSHQPPALHDSQIKKARKTGR